MSTPAGEPSNPHLLRAMHAAALNDNPETRRAVYEALLSSTFLVPVANSPANERRRVLREDVRMELVVAHKPGGEAGLLVFSDEQALRRWKPAGCGFVGSNARELFSIAMKSGFDAVVINVSGPSGGEITRHEFQFLAEGAIPSQAEPVVLRAVIEQGQDTYIGAPARKPSDALKAAVREGLAGLEEVRAAYLFQAKIGKGEPHLVLGLLLNRDFPKQTIERIVRDLMQALQHVLPDGEVVDCMVLTEALLNAVRQAVPAAFERAA